MLNSKSHVVSLAGCVSCRAVRAVLRFTDVVGLGAVIAPVGFADVVGLGAVVAPFVHAVLLVGITVYPIILVAMGFAGSVVLSGARIGSIIAS